MAASATVPTLGPTAAPAAGSPALAHAPVPAPGRAVARPLGPVDQVATLLLAMGKPAAGRMLKYFEPAELKRITHSAVQLGEISTDQVEEVVQRFATEFSLGASLVGTVQEVEKLLAGLLPPEQIVEFLAEARDTAPQTVWDSMAAVSEGVLASYLVKEHPQTSALILSRIKPASAARVMGHLPAPLRDTLMRRMLSFKTVDKDTLLMLERALHEDFMTKGARNPGADPHAKMADIINKMDRDQMDEVLSSLSGTRPKSVEILKGLLFTFDDIVKLGSRSRTTLFDAVPNDRLVLALKGTDLDFRSVILSALSARVRRMVEHELNGGEPAAQRDVMEARRFIIDLAVDMSSRGEIETNPGSEDNALIR